MFVSLKAFEHEPIVDFEQAYVPIEPKPYIYFLFYL
jgi:hypothetical protein